MQCIRVGMEVPDEVDLNRSFTMPSITILAKDSTGLGKNILSRLLGSATIDLAAFLAPKERLQKLEQPGERQEQIERNEGYHYPNQIDPETQEKTSDLREPLLFESMKNEDGVKIVMDPDETVVPVDIESLSGHSRDAADDEPVYLKNRPIVNGDLEEHAEDLGLDLKPLHEFELYRGSHPCTRAGTFKGLIRIVDDEPMPAPMRNQLRLLQSSSSVFVRLYVLRAAQLVPKDRSGRSDPYLVVSLPGTASGNQQSTRERYCRQTLNPEFFEVFQFTARLPGLKTNNHSVFQDSVPIRLWSLNTFSLCLG